MIDKKSFRVSLAIVASVVAGVLCGVPAAFAAKSTATLALESDTVAAWSSFHASGCGYATGQQVNVGVDSPYWNAGFSVPVDANGCVAFMFWVDGPGSYTVRTYQGHRPKLLASAVLTVV